MKRTVFLLIALLLIGAVLPAAAQSTPDLTALAAYFPPNTPMYVSFRTDDAMFDQLEAVRAHFNAALPGPLTSDTTVHQMLDEMLAAISSDGTFATAVRPWMGDSAAFGALSIENLMGEDEGPMLIAVSITDRAQAQAFFEATVPAGSTNVTTTETYTLITPADSARPAAVYINDQVLLLTNKPEVLAVNGLPGPSLAENEQFQSSLAALPEPAYSLFGYVDYHALMQANMREMQAMQSGSAGMGMSLELMGPMLDAFGGMSMGVTVLNDRSLTADIGLEWNPAALGDLMPELPAFAPIDPAFAAHLPAGTQIAMQSTDLSASIQTALANLETMIALEMENGAGPGGAANPLAAIGLGVRGLTGLDLEDDILSWMTGQYAFGFSLDFQTMLESMSDEALPRALQFAFVVENTDGAGAQALVAGLSEGLTQLTSADRTGSITITEETVGGAPAILISAAGRGMREPFEILIGGNDSVFVIGTPAMARAALAPDGGLDTDAGYQETVASALPSTPALFYGSGDFLNRMVELMFLGQSIGSSQDMTVGPMFSSTGLSAVYSDTAITTRMVLTLSAG